jgi:hypothetical protein
MARWRKQQWTNIFNGELSIENGLLAIPTSEDNK